MEYIVEKDQKVKKLTEGEKESLAKKIVENFQTYDRGRQSQLDKAQLLINEIYFKNVAKKSTNPEKQWSWGAAPLPWEGECG